MSALGVSRTTEPLRFDVGIGSAGYAEIINSPEAEGPQKSLLPGTTTVSQAIDEIFPQDGNIEGEILDALIAGNPPSLRMSGGFSDAARRAARMLRSGNGTAAGRAAAEIEGLLADTDLFERYRLALLET